MTIKHDKSGQALPTLRASWEHDSASPGRPVAVEFTFTVPPVAADKAATRLPLNVGLAIDRSGSMDGGKLDAARRAAVGVLDALSDGERFAATAFDDQVDDVTESVVLDESVRERIRARLATLDTGGSTALFDGFARSAELVALGGHPSQADSWVIVLSDGMGNHGLTDPVSMKKHASALAERGIRAISIGIGADYEAAQLTALSDGGCGEFHHASQPGEIVEIVLGEVQSLRDVVARDLRLRVSVRGADRWLLLGGDVTLDGRRGQARFDRVAAGRVVRAVALVWPDGALPEVSVDAEWLDEEQQPCSLRLEDAPAVSSNRDQALALRAARLWHADVLARALESNEAGRYREAESFLGKVREEFSAYVHGLPQADELLGSLLQVSARVGRAWSSMGHREVYTRAYKTRRGTADVRDSAPRNYEAALAMDGEE